jgi:spermidine/putrescine transport system permease protein
MTGSRAGWWAMAPVAAFLLAGFVAPVSFIAWTSLMPPRTFGLSHPVTFENYRTMATDGYWRSLMWSSVFAFATMIITALIAWPMAKALVTHAGRFATVISALVAIPVFIAESVRLFGAQLFLMPRGGIFAGSMKALFGVDVGSILFTPWATLLGLVYIYLPFALFPMVLGLAQVPRDQVEAARDLGAGGWRVLREIEIPIALPGILIGALLVFVLALGATIESTILGGTAVTVAVQAIQERFNYAQDWPLGAALATVLAAVTAALVYPLMRWLDIDRLFGR